MVFFHRMLEQQLELIFLIAIGIILNKTRVITDKSRGSISDLLINLMLPASVLGAFLSTERFTPELMQNCMDIFIISVVTHALTVLFGGRIFRCCGKEKEAIMHYGMIVPNTAFIGIPVAGALFGDTGLLYTSVYFIPSEICMWTFALALFKKNENVNIFKAIMTTPAADAVFLGLIILISGISLPEFITNGILSLGSCTTPVSMLVIGAILADADYKKIISAPILSFTIVRLVIFPLIIFVFMKLMSVDDTVLGIGLVMAAMPAAAATSILADKFNADAEFATNIVVMSTIFSIVTIPLITLLL